MCEAEYAEYEEDVTGDKMGKELIKPEWRDSYEKHHALLWSELVALNHYLFYLERIADFPWQLLCGQRNHFHFWEFAYLSMYETSLIMVQRVAFDTDSETLTLRRFHNEITKNLVDEQAAAKLRERLKTRRLRSRSKEIKKIEKRIKFVRDNLLAHLSQDIMSENHQEKPYLALVPARDLREIVLDLNEFFQVLCLGVECAMTLPELIRYSQPSHGPRFDPDIVKLLDLIAEHSPVLNMPDKDAANWSFYRTDLSPNDIGVLNEWRAKFDLPAV